MAVIARCAKLAAWRAASASLTARSVRFPSATISPVCVAAIADPEVTTVVQIAPATRTAWASSFGKQDGELGVERMCAALKEMGVDYVFDTVFAADLTIMEEGTELLNIVKAGETDRLPLFTSCCPGWVNFARTRYPESIAQHLSSAKSPMQMFGAVVKTWFAEKNGLGAREDLLGRAHAVHREEGRGRTAGHVLEPWRA